MPVDIKVEVKGPVRGSLTKAIAVVVGVGLEYNCFMETQDRYKVCIGYRYPDEKKAIIKIGKLLGKNNIDGLDNPYYWLYDYFRNLVKTASKNRVNESYAGYTYTIESDELGLKIRHNEWYYWFCLTLNKSHWKISYEFVENKLESVYVFKPDVEVFGLKVTDEKPKV